MTRTSPRAATDADFPTGAPLAEQLEALLNWAVLAPSVMNTQPWRFAIEEEAVLLFADRTRQLTHVDPEGRELILSCGAALFTLRLAARHFGFATVVERVPDPDRPDLLARVRLAGAARATDHEEALFRAVKHRHTNRRRFADTPLPSGLLRFLQNAAEAEGARLTVVEKREAKAEIGALVGEAVRLQGADRAMADELHTWLRGNQDPRVDGVPDRVQAGLDRVSYLRSDPSRFARQAETLAATAPALLLLSTPDDSPLAWIQAGEALQHVLLSAALHEVSASYLNQPVEVPSLRGRLAAFAGGGRPHVLFRVGFAADLSGSERRGVRDVLADPASS